MGFESLFWLHARGIGGGRNVSQPRRGTAPSADRDKVKRSLPCKAKIVWCCACHSEIHFHSCQQNVEVAFRLPPGDVAEAVLEPTFYVRVQVPVNSGHQLRQPAPCNISAVEVNKRVTRGHFPCTPATLAPVEIVVRDNPRKACVLAVVWAGLPGEEPTGRGVNTVEARHLAIVLAHSGVQIFALDAEGAVHPSDFRAATRAPSASMSPVSMT